MAQIHDWELVSDRYTENISIANGDLVHSYHSYKGIVTLEKERILEFECRIRPSDSVPSIPTFNQYTAYAPVRGGYVRSFTALDGRNYINETSMNGDWYQNGPVQFGGKDDDIFGVQVWKCQLISSAVDVKRLEWQGKMTPARFRATTTIHFDV